jgi:beta-glucosidase
MPFPAAFAWGAAIPSTQAEGAAPASDWRDWERQNRAPYSGDGGGFATKYRDDLRLIADAGLGHVRLCLEWARLEPENGRQDPRAVDHYRQVLSAATDAGLRPWVTLIDRSLPAWFAIDERGFRDRQARSYMWPRHVEFCAETFGEWVDRWVPILRPLRLARDGYLVGDAPPGRRHLSQFLDTLIGVHQGLGEAWRVLRGGAPVAAAYDIAEVRSKGREPSSQDRTARVDALHWCWTAALRDGEITIPGYGTRLTPALRDAFDLIAVTIEDRVIIDDQGAWSTKHAPDDVGALAHRLAEHSADRPLAVVGQQVDNPDWLAGVLNELEACLADDVPLIGWFAEPAIDGYDHLPGFRRGVGLWDRDRRPRPSLELLAGVAAANRPPDPVDLDAAVLLDRP